MKQKKYLNYIDLRLASLVGGVGWCDHDYSHSSVVISDDIRYVYSHIYTIHYY